MAEIELFTTKFTPFGQRVQIALTEKKISFHVTTVEYGNKPQALLDANPIHKKVPTIIHSGKPVAESLVILEYLEDAFPEQAPLMPKDAFEKSQVRFWVDYVNTSFTKLTDIIKSTAGSPERQAGQEAVVSSLVTLNSAIASFSPDGPFFTGEKFGIIDVVMAPLCNALVVFADVFGLSIPGRDVLPRLYQCLDAVRAHPSVSAVLPSVDETVKYMSARFPRASEAPAPQ